MPKINQKIKGKTVKYIDVEASTADLTELNALLEGEIVTFDLKSEGGAVAPYPTSLNRKKFSCGDRDSSVSCSFTVPHCKETAYITDFESAVIGNFDASYESSVTADYTNLLYDRN